MQALWRHRRRKHFLLMCDMNMEEREYFFQKISRVYVGFTRLKNEEKLSLILNNEDPQCLSWLGEFLYRSFEKRTADSSNCQHTNSLYMHVYIYVTCICISICVPPLLHSGTGVYCHGHCTSSIYSMLYVVMYAYMFEQHHIRAFMCVYVCISTHMYMWIYIRIWHWWCCF